MDLVFVQYASTPRPFPIRSIKRLLFEQFASKDINSKTYALERDTRRRMAAVAMVDRAIDYGYTVRRSRCEIRRWACV